MYCKIYIYIFFLCVCAEGDRVDEFILFFACVFVWPSFSLLLIISVSERRQRARFDLLLLKKKGAVCQAFI